MEQEKKDELIQLIRDIDEVVIELERDGLTVGGSQLTTAIVAMFIYKEL